MFEQESYDPEQEVQPTSEGELFQGYEIKNWEFTPRIYKILAVSAVLNILIFAAFAQTSILTMRGCDSPFVGNVCTVLDMAYVGTVLFGTEREFVDIAYERTDLGDMDVTFISMDGVEPMFEYPPGYFRLANPEQFVEPETLGFDPMKPGSTVQNFPPPTSLPPARNDLANRPQRLPKRNPNPVKGEIGDPWGNDEDDKTVAQNDPKSGTNANVNTGTGSNSANANTGNANPEAVLGVDINKRPMTDLANFVNELRDKNAVNIESEFVVNARGRLDKNGRIQANSFRFLQASSDDTMILDLVKRSVEAVNDAGYFQYLKELGGKDFNMQLEQDEENVTALVQSEMETPERARSVRSTLNLALSLAKFRKQGEAQDQNDKDDLILLENAVIEANGKNVIIKFTVPKAVVHPMIQRKLAEQKAEQAKPNGNAGMRPSDKTVAR
ncbi:hypothetical protein [Leptolyngbya sp. 7M]|uniref:hypothetical protein n=1 Tax=Leptolyngbya sp. 7M TaxID=2812896 RepID=UPI001B8D8798|nr:hypothetical protein [Leptolyngbya sp. 7M]QYO65764.1 hypothetical protein JVX88_02930 [Leptolyngbya sp. 7M]